MGEKIEKLILDYKTPQNKDYHLASRSLENVDLFLEEIQAVYQYLFDDVKINQLLIDILTTIPVGENEDLSPNESFTTFEKQENAFIPREIVLPKISSSLQGISLIGETARIMKNQNVKENLENETLVEFLKTISSVVISNHMFQNEELGEVFKLFQINQLKKIIVEKGYGSEIKQKKIYDFMYMICLREQYQKYPQEVLHEIKKVLLNYKTTDQILNEVAIDLQDSEKFVYQYIYGKCL